MCKDVTRDNKKGQSHDEIARCNRLIASQEYIELEITSKAVKDEGLTARITSYGRN